MKYIRTKYGEVYEIDHDYRTGAFTGNGYIRFKATPTKIASLIHKNCVIKQADTIEELCDEYVAFAKEDNYPLVRNKAAFSWLSSFISREKFGKIYGAVWTDKGLIYVAKMNDKGELELL